MMSLLRSLVTALSGLCLLVRAASADPLTFDQGNVGPPLSNARAELFTPAGSGPFPAVVVLHGCDGVGRHYRIWARTLASWGYMALVVDSLRPRGFAEICNRGQVLPPDLRARDAFNAADYLRSLAKVDPERIGVIGFSHGGWTVLRAVLAETVKQASAKPFAAAVAFYPGCEPPRSALMTDTLILIGEADDWTPVDRCARWRDRVDAARNTIRLKAYPGALHGFDAPAMPHMYAGHHVGRHPEAAADALVETRTFFAERLQRGR